VEICGLSCTTHSGRLIVNRCWPGVNSQPALATGFGNQLWQPALATSFGNQLGQPALATSFGNQLWQTAWANGFGKRLG
jgi:hypothetical protein